MNCVLSSISAADRFGRTLHPTRCEKGISVTCASEKRQGERLKMCCIMQIIAKREDLHETERPALSVDISEGGACANTTHRLAPGEMVEVVLDTAEAGQRLGIPAQLRGLAEVKRVESHGNDWRKVALSFAPALAQSLEMALFVAYLYGMHAPLAAPTQA